MSLQILTANEQDAAILAQIESQCPMSAVWGLKGISEEIKRGDALILKAVCGGEIAGFISGRFVLERAEINNLAVGPKFERRGAATSLIGEFANCARKKNCSKIMLEVSEINAKAVSLYKKLGFVIVGGRPKFYNGVYDAVLMDKKL